MCKPEMYEDEMDVQIEKGVPIGKSFRKEPDNEWRDTLLKMEIGDSFVIDEGDDENRAQYQAISYHAKKIGITIKGTKEDERHRRIHRTK